MFSLPLLVGGLFLALLLVNPVAAVAPQEVALPSAMDSTAAVSATLVGRVTNSITGLPVRGVAAEACVWLGEHCGRHPIDFTDRNGYFRIEGLDPGEYLIDYHIEGQGDTPYYHTQWFDGVSTQVSATIISLAAGQVFTANAALVPTAVISGYITDAGGRPVPSAQVIACGLAPPNNCPRLTFVRADRYGAYEVRGLGPGDYRIQASTVGTIELGTAYYGGGDDFVESTSIPITTSQIVSNINVQLPGQISNLPMVLTD